MELLGFKKEANVPKIFILNSSCLLHKIILLDYIASKKKQNKKAILMDLVKI